ncbi:MAG: hypothetical protein AB1696_05615 [Planctomycetota bacterium]
MRQTHNTRRPPPHVLMAFALCASVCVLAADAGGALIQLDSNAARPVKLLLAGKDIPLSSQGGGFSIHDVKQKKDVTLGQGTLREADGGIVFATGGDDLEIEAEFIPEGGGGDV